ncbi:MAG: VOC family protein, partial [Thermoleophilia bacterium]|nr:VOC family protein [Thermoleophilia bacterium]
MADGPETPPVLQLRLVVEAEDFDRALVFYRDVLGLPEQAAFEAEGDA